MSLDTTKGFKCSWFASPATVCHQSKIILLGFSYSLLGSAYQGNQKKNCALRKSTMSHDLVLPPVNQTAWGLLSYHHTLHSLPTKVFPFKGNVWITDYKKQSVLAGALSIPAFSSFALPTQHGENMSLKRTDHAKILPAAVLGKQEKNI